MWQWSMAPDNNIFVPIFNLKSQQNQTE